MILSLFMGILPDRSNAVGVVLWSMGIGVCVAGILLYCRKLRKLQRENEHLRRSLENQELRRRNLKQRSVEMRKHIRENHGSMRAKPMPDPCYICWETKFVPMLLRPCGHIVCADCMLRWMTRADDWISHCGYCRRQIDDMLLDSLSPAETTPKSHPPSPLPTTSTTTTTPLSIELSGA